MGGPACVLPPEWPRGCCEGLAAAALSPGRLTGVCGLSGSRKRISLSCERLRALLPRFDGRREDMASVLEMSVQFLRMAGTVLPSGEQQAVSVQARSAHGGAAAPTAPSQLHSQRGSYSRSLLGAHPTVITPPVGAAPWSRPWCQHGVRVPLP